MMNKSGARWALTEWLDRFGIHDSYTVFQESDDQIIIRRRTPKLLSDLQTPILPEDKHFLEFLSLARYIVSYLDEQKQALSVEGVSNDCSFYQR